VGVKLLDLDGYRGDDGLWENELDHELAVTGGGSVIMREIATRVAADFEEGTLGISDEPLAEWARPARSWESTRSLNQAKRSWHMG
jgi:hypothetical protein